MNQLHVYLGGNLNAFLFGVSWFQQDALFAVHFGPFLLAFQWGEHKEEENDD